MEATGQQLALAPQERAVGYFVREPFPSIATGTSLRAGKLDQTALHVTSRMNDGGVIFADGIEQDFRSEEQTSELQPLMRISYAVFCLKTNIKIYMVIIILLYY